MSNQSISQSYRPGYNPKFIKTARENNKKRAEEKRRAALELEMKKRRDEIEQRIKAENAKNLLLQGIKRTTYQTIEYRICTALKITRTQIRSDRKKREIVLARQAIMYWSTRLTSLSYPKIGQLMGGRDHTTIIHGVNAYQKKRKDMNRHLSEVR